MANQHQLSYRYFTSALHDSEDGIFPHGQTAGSSEHLRTNEPWQKCGHPLMLLRDLRSIHISFSPCRCSVIPGQCCTGSPWKDVNPAWGCCGREHCLCNASSVCTAVGWLQSLDPLMMGASRRSSVAHGVCWEVNIFPMKSSLELLTVS